MRDCPEFNRSFVEATYLEDIFHLCLAEECEGMVVDSLYTDVL